eukprot:CAMPEP_0178402264 /NCGR_PEP_ID=MMETSP0689_2-20121128/16744_1 /TAXON_ID=160604 /ORGANISM="Amphidinium massartii, Strain CS-259" /LENGTH=1104 /DNA_ID=CAMNT_0020023143 /DNA_START=9 /DNA_END=3320 /DNA_ORIENTATION=+
MDPKTKEAIRNYVNYSVNAEEAREVHLPTVLASLKQGNLQLLDIVVELQDAFTSVENPKQRRLAVQLLSDCIDESAPGALNFKQVDVFVNFFCSKLSDYQCVEGAIVGLRVLLMKHGPVLRTLQNDKDGGAPIAVYITRSLLKEVHTPSHTQSVRKSMLETMHVLLEEWRAEAERLGTFLGEGVAAMIDEERDPRNLLLSFAIAAKLLENVNEACISQETLQTLFESLTSYFPITFKPPKGDKIGITPEDLRSGLNQALSCCPRFAPLLIPFLLDSCKDITAGDEEPTIYQAIELLLLCMQKYGTDIARKHLSDVMVTAHDQMCRTTTPCPDEFAKLARGCLEVALKGIPPGLQPHWFAKDVDPTLQGAATDAADDSASLARRGARKLLLSIASAHSVLFERVWAVTTSTFTKRAEACEGDGKGRLPESGVVFFKDLADIADGATASKRVPKLAPRQIKPLLATALTALRAVKPDAGETEENILDGPAHLKKIAEQTSFLNAVHLVGVLAALVGEDASKEAFDTLCSLLLTVPASDEWASRWRKEFVQAAADEERVAMVVAAVRKVVERQPSRAAELIPLLMAASDSGAPWSAKAMPYLCTASTLSLSRRAHREPKAMPKVKDENGALDAAIEEASKLANQALKHIASLCSATASGTDAALRAVAEVMSTTEKSSSEVVLQWLAVNLLETLGLPDGLSSFCEGHEAKRGDNLAQLADSCAQFCLILLENLPAADAVKFRATALQAAASSGASGLCLRMALVRASLQDCDEAVVKELWPHIQSALAAAQACLLGSEAVSPELDEVALEAVEASVKACPAENVSQLLERFRKKVGPLLGSGGKSQAPLQEHVAKAAVRSWACVASALLRRGGFGSQAGDFLEGLLQALDGAGPGAAFVPLAFEVLMPPQVAATPSQSSKLPPLARQQIALTTLPPLIVKAKKAEAGSVAHKAALESAVTILAALPIEAAATDCPDEMRWCAVVGLKQLQVQAAAGNPVTSSSTLDTGDTRFGVQVLQLLVRASLRSSAWIEDDLNAVVLPLLEIFVSHPVPLARLGALQVMHLLIKNSHGHLMTFRRQLAKALRRASEDRRREVRLLAVACINAWE